MSASDLVAAAVRAYREVIDTIGVSIEIRRGAKPNVQTVHVRAVIKGFAPDELIGNIEQGDSKVIVLAEDVSLDPPLATDDRLVVRGKTLSIQTVDDNTRRIGGVLVAYELLARGHR